MSPLTFSPLASRLLQASGDANSSAGFIQMIILMLVMFVFFYWVLYRPEKKRRKILEQMRSQMKPGDRVTVMGILGTIDSIKEDTLIVRMVDGGKIEFLRAAVTDVESSASPTS